MSTDKKKQGNFDFSQVRFPSNLGICSPTSDFKGLKLSGAGVIFGFVLCVGKYSKVREDLRVLVRKITSTT